MIDEIIEYKHLLVDRIALGNYHSSNKKDKTYPFRVKKDDKRANPPSGSLLIIRHFLFKEVDNWSSLSFLEREQRIHTSKVAFLCWLGDKESYKEGRTLLKDEFNDLVKDDEGAYEIFCNTNLNADKLRMNRLSIIEKLKSTGDFYKNEKCEGKYDYAPYRFHTLIPNAIALGPLKSIVIGVRKDEIIALHELVASYKFVGPESFDMERNGYWAVILLLSTYMRVLQVRYYKGDVDKYIELSNEEILSLIDKGDKYLKLNGSKLKFMLRLAASSLSDNVEKTIDDERDFVFDFISSGSTSVFKNLWRPKASITKYVHVFEDGSSLPSEEEYIFFKGHTGPDYIDAFIDELSI